MKIGNTSKLFHWKDWKTSWEIFSMEIFQQAAKFIGKYWKYPEAGYLINKLSLFWKNWPLYWIDFMYFYTLLNFIKIQILNRLGLFWIIQFSKYLSFRFLSYIMRIAQNEYRMSQKWSPKKSRNEEEIETIVLRLDILLIDWLMKINYVI